MLKAIHDTLEDIPEQYRELYTERDGKYELTGVEGVKTLNDVTRVQEGLNNEKRRHQETADLLKPFKDLGKTPDEIRAELDKIPEMQAQIDAGGGQIDEEKMEALVAAKVKTQVTPIERENEQLKTQLAEITGERDVLQGEKRQRQIHDVVITAATDMKIIPEAFDDVKMFGERVLEITDDGSIVTRDGVGVTPGIAPADWLSEIQDKKPYWWPTSQGGGAGGTDGSGSGIGGVSNKAWTAEGWNVTEQNKILREHGMEKAQQLAKSAGTMVGGLPPEPKKQA